MKEDPERSLRNLIFRVGIAALLIINAFTACVPQRNKQASSNRPAGIVRGELKKDGQAIEGARVMLSRITEEAWQFDSKTAKTGSDGRFVFENLSPGSYYFHIEFETRGAAPCTTSQPGFKSYQVNAASWHPLINASNDSFPVSAGDDLKFTVEFTCPYSAFDQHINEYISFSKLANRNEPPYLSGKTVIMDERGMSKLHFDLPEEIRANDPKAVGTVVFMECKLDAVGYYAPSGAPASETVCEISLIDLKRKAVINRRRFREGVPQSSDTSGAQPRSDAIVTFINGLPRR